MLAVAATTMPPFQSGKQRPFKPCVAVRCVCASTSGIEFQQRRADIFERLEVAQLEACRRSNIIETPCDLQELVRWDVSVLVQRSELMHKETFGLPQVPAVLQHSMRKWVTWEEVPPYNAPSQLTVPGVRVICTSSSAHGNHYGSEQATQSAHSPRIHQLHSISTPSFVGLQPIEHQLCRLRRPRYRHKTRTRCNTHDFSRLCPRTGPAGPCAMGRAP